MSGNLGIQVKDLSMVIDGKNQVLSLDKMDFVKLEKGSKLKISKKVAKVEDLLAIKNGENLEIYYSDGSSVVLEDFYILENISLELPTSENETHLLFSRLEETSETTIIYAQGDMSKFVSLLENNEFLLNALDEYNHSLSGMNAGDTMATTAGATDIATAGSFAGLSQTAMLVIGGVVVAGTAVAIGSGGGSSSSNSTSSTTSSTGYFVDSAVGGVDYYIDGVYVGKTGSDGSFKYNSGDTIIFKIGNITLGSLTANEIPSDGKVMPQDIVGVSRNDVSNSTVVKIAQLLQTLDSDGDASNGITIDATKVTDTTANLEEGTGTALSSMTFSNGVTLVTEENAKAHLLETTTTIQASSLGVTVDKVVIISIDDTTLKNGQIATVTFTFNAFNGTPTENDFSVQGGTLGTLSQVGTTKVWTATFTPTTSLEDSTNLITVKTDGTLGTAGYKGASANYTIDTIVPTAPTINAVSTDDLINASENTAGFNLTGTGDVGATVTVSGFATANKTAVVQSNGTWSIAVTDADLADNGSNILSATQTDVSGNVSSATTKTITTDLVVNAPTINTVSTDDLINATENTNGFNLTGTGEIGATITVSGFETANKTAVVDGSGNWSIAVTDADLANNGSNILSATQTDVAGNVSSATTKTITTDFVAPILQSWSADSSTNTITLTYDSQLDSVNLPATTDFTVTTDSIPNTVSNVSVSGNTITLTMTTDFLQGDAVTVVYTDADGNTANAIQDLSGNDATDINLSSGLVADGYVRGATIYIKPSGDTTGLTLVTINGEELFNTGLTTDEEGNFFLPPNTPAGSIVAIGGINIDTGVPNTMPLKAPEGSTVINPLTTLVQKIVDSGTSATDAANAVKTAFGIDSSTDITKFDPISENNASVQKAAATIATITILAGEENQNTVLDNFTDQILNPFNDRSFYFNDAGFVGLLLEDTGLGFEAQSIIVDASMTIARATNISDISQAQSKFLDTIAPSSSTIADTIGNNIHNNTNDTTPTIKVNINTVSVDGTAVVLGDTVYLTIDGVHVQEKVIDATDLENSYVEFTTSSLVEGTYAISAQVEDKSGNISNLYNTYTIVIDTTLPTSPTISKVAVDDIINNTEATNGVTLTGITEAGTTVTVNGQSATVNGTTWSYTLTIQSITDMGQGAETLTIVSTDLAGNTSQVIKSITIDTLAPAQTVTVTGINDNVEPNIGTLASGDTTNDNTLGLTGIISSSLASGEKIAVYNGTTLLGFANVTDTTWTFATSSLSNNTHNFSAKVVDNAGNEGSLSEVFSVIVDASIPDIIATIINSNAISNQTTQTITGTLSKELTTEVVKVFVDGVVVGEATVNGTNWSYEVTGLSEGTHNFMAVVENLGGNQGTISTPYNLEIDTIAPTVTITDNKSSITNGDIPYTITFSKDVINFTAEDIVVTNGTKGTFSQVSDSVYTLVVIPNENFTGDVTVDVAQNIATDSAGNGNTAANTNIQAVDTEASSVVINTISTDNAINKAEKTAGVDITGTAEANGTIVLTLGTNNTKTVTVNGSGQWTYTLTEADYKALGEGSKEITAKQTDIAGNVSQTATKTLTISTVAPSLSPVTLDTVSDTGLTGDRISSNDMPTFNFTASSGAQIWYRVRSNDFIQYVDSQSNPILGIGTKQTITLQPIEYNGTLIIVFKAIDSEGNESNTRTTTYTFDTKAPTATITMADSALKIGETSLVTITFSEVVTNFANEDLIVAGGTLSTVQTADEGKTWTATFTPTANLEDTTNVITLANTYTDISGNTGTIATSENYVIDTKAPTATITMADSALKIGETSLVTITFSEVVTNFANEDLIVAGGTLSTVQTADEGKTWTATFTPTANLEDTTNVITLANTYTDISGNTGTIATSENYVIDTKAPTATITTSLVTKDTTPIIAGKAEAGATITAEISGAIYEVIAAQNGEWSVNLESATPKTGTLTPLQVGQNYTVTVNVIDVAGNNAQTQTQILNVVENQAPYINNLIWIHNDDVNPVMYIGKGQPVNINLQNYVRDEDGDNVTITVDSSSLPAGLSVSNGIITGSTIADSGSITITFSDGTSSAQTQTILLQTITPPSEDDMTIVNGNVDSSFNATTILSGLNGFFEIDEDNGEMYFGNIKINGTAGTYNEYQLDGDLNPDSTDNFTFNQDGTVTGGWGTENLSFTNAREVRSINGVTTTGLKAVDVTFTMVTPATVQTSTDWWESGYTTWNQSTQQSEPITSLSVLRDSMLVTSNWGGDVWINEDFRVKLNGTTGSTSGTLVEMVTDGTYSYYTDEDGMEKTYEHRVAGNEVTNGTWSIETIDGIEYLVVEVQNEGTTAFKVEEGVLMQTELPASGTTETMTWYYGVDLTTFGETVDMISSIDTGMVDGKYEISLLNDISLDLSDLSYSENLLSINTDNGVSNNLTFTESDVLSMGNNNELYLDLDTFDTFDTTGWTAGSITDVGGVSYTSYTSNDATIYLNTTTETVL